MLKERIAPEAADELYDAHLQRVSRSFAFCIPQLRQPLRRQVASSYLLFRVADTIEDASFPEARREELFDRFDALLERPDPDEAARLAGEFDAGVTEGERALVADLPALLADLHSFEPEVRAAIVTALRSMIIGMRYFLARGGGRLQLHTAGEADLYCFFVAGLVGELLSALVAHDRGLALGEMLVDAHRFGRFLQKVNIVKDAASDRALGRELVPDGVEGSLAGDARGALRYILHLPPSAAGDYRIFCAWSLFLGLFTLARLRSADAASSRRQEVEELLAVIAAAANDDAALRALFEQGAAALPPATEPAPPFVPDSRLRGVRTGLTAGQLAELGLVLPGE